MTIENPNQILSYEAAADLSSNRWYAVKLDSDGKVAAIESTADIPFGILRNKPETGEAAEISPIGSGGVCRMILGATLDEGALCSTSAVGSAAAAASGSYTIGTVIKGGASSEIGSVMLNNLIVKA